MGSGKRIECVTPRWRGRRNAQKRLRAAERSASANAKSKNISERVFCWDAMYAQSATMRARRAEMENFEILLFLWSMSGRIEAAAHRSRESGEKSWGNGTHTARKRTVENAMWAAQYIYTLSTERRSDLKEECRWISCSFGFLEGFLAS